MSSTAIERTQDQGAALAAHDDTAAVIERLITAGDLSKLSAPDRVTYYNGLCRSLGLNPFTRPFEYLTLSGKLVLYARKDATEQLRKINHISVYRLDKEQDGDLYTVTAYARTPEGREDSDMGAVSTKGLSGDALVNARLKAVTKAKRRVTLSICGLGFLDETEVETIPGARVQRDEREVPPQPAAQLPPPDGGERGQLLSNVREACRELNARGHKPPWTETTLATYVNHEFMVSNGLDALSEGSLRDLLSRLNSKLDALLAKEEEERGADSDEAAL